MLHIQWLILNVLWLVLHVLYPSLSRSTPYPFLRGPAQHLQKEGDSLSLSRKDPPFCLLFWWFLFFFTKLEIRSTKPITLKSTSKMDFVFSEKQKFITPYIIELDGFWHHFWALTFFDVSECNNFFLCTSFSPLLLSI